MNFCLDNFKTFQFMWFITMCRTSWDAVGSLPGRIPTYGGIQSQELWEVSPPIQRDHSLIWQRTCYFHCSHLEEALSYRQRVFLVKYLAFSLSFDLAPLPPPPLPVSKFFSFSVFLCAMSPVELTDDGRCEGRKPGPLKIIQYSLATAQAKHLIPAFFLLM